MAEKQTLSGWAYWRSWLFWVLALYYCWYCTKNESLLMRVIYLAIANFFSFYYLCFYVIYHYILREPCSKSFGSQGILV